MSNTSPSGLRRRVWTIAAVVALIAAAPVAVIASHSFTDVPDSNQFHGSIDWMQRNGVTVGCNPPANDQFCPSDNVSREQMASFMRRFAQTLGNVGVNVTDPADTVDTTGTAFVELLTLQVTPTDEAEVVLNAHVTLTKDATLEGTYEVIIAEGTCADPAVGSASWLGEGIGTTAETDTISLTASDVVSVDTTYVLCAAETVDASPAATASTRGLTASWVPTS